LDSLQLKFDQLEAQNSENVEKIDLLEAKNVKQEEEIIKLKTKIDAKLDSHLVSIDERVLHSTKLDSEHLRGPLSLNDEPILYPVENTKKISLNNRKEDIPDAFSTRATVPSSCRELSLIGHSLDGFLSS